MRVKASPAVYQLHIQVGDKQNLGHIGVGWVWGGE